jgi:hypothetical protein
MAERPSAEAAGRPIRAGVEDRAGKFQSALWGSHHSGYASRWLSSPSRPRPLLHPRWPWCGRRPAAAVAAKAQRGKIGD